MARQQLALMIRQSYRYDTGWACLDEWDHLGGYSVLKYRATVPDDDGRMIHAWTVRVDPHQGTSKDKIRAALLTGFAWGCRCEHDCCGHRQGSAREAVHKGGREWVVTGSSYLNI